MSMLSDPAEIALVVDLLRQTTTQQVIQTFLKSKDLPSSGTWDELRDKRILPAVAAGAVTREELIQLLRSSEECGRQHVFLYSCKPKRAIEIMAEARVRAAAATVGLEHLVEQAAVLDQPHVPTFVDIRWDRAAVDLRMYVKEVEQRRSRHLLGEVEDLDSCRVTRTYEVRNERAVNLVRLHRTGLLEMRIAARSTGSRKYDDAVRSFWYRLRFILQDSDFSMISLAPFKNRLMLGDADLKAKVRSSNSVLRNEFGTRMDVSSGADDADLYGDSGAEKGAAAFLAENGGHCEGSVFAFVKNADLSRDIHVLLSGAPNEFAISADCSEADYEYVLHQIRAFNT